MKKDNLVLKFWIGFLIITVILLIMGLLGWGRVNASVENNYDNIYDNIYQFTGKVEIIGSDYWTLRVLDSGNTDLVEDDIIEVFQALVADVHNYNSPFLKATDGYTYLTSEDAKNKKSTIVTTVGVPILEYDDIVVVNLINNVDKSYSHRLMPLSIEKN